MSISIGRFTGTEYLIARGNPGDFSNPQILYLFVEYTIQNGKITFADYGTGSGFYDIGDGVDAFVDNLIDGNQPSNSDLISAVQPGDVPTIRASTFVVFAINSKNNPVVSFRLQPNAVVTDDGITNQATTPDYVNVVHVLNDYTRYQNPSTHVPATPCYVLYFQAMFAQQASAVTDQFNLYVFVNNQIQVIDPALKNKGHPPPPQLVQHRR